MQLYDLDNVNHPNHYTMGGVVYTDEYTPTSSHVRIRPVTVEYRPDEYVIIDYTDWRK